MIIENGTIEFKEKTPGKIDPETGYPTKATGRLEQTDPLSVYPQQPHEPRQGQRRAFHDSHLHGTD